MAKEHDYRVNKSTVIIIENEYNNILSRVRYFSLLVVRGPVRGEHCCAVSSSRNRNSVARTKRIEKNIIHVCICDATYTELLLYVYIYQSSRSPASKLTCNCRRFININTVVHRSLICRLHLPCVPCNILCTERDERGII